MSTKLSLRPGIAEREWRRDLIEIVGTERQHMGERHRIVEIDEGVDARELTAGEHVLDQPLDRGAIARLLDAETLVGVAPRRNPGNLRSSMPAQRARAAASRSRSARPIAETWKALSVSVRLAK